MNYYEFIKSWQHKNEFVNVESNHVLWYVFSLFDVIYMSDYKI
jgi:hypothetical protein